MTEKSLYIVWAEFQRRAVSMEDRFEFEVAHLPTGGSSKFAKAAVYARRSADTLALLFKRRPKVVWTQCPPNFILLICLFYRRFINPDARIVADCHNASLRSPWINLPLSRWALNRCDMILVHNVEVIRQAAMQGLDPELLVVLEDAPAYAGKPDADAGSSTQVYALVPCSFHDDEPIDDLLMAAAEVPDICFKITGPKAKAEKLGFVADAPPNVTFTGFVSEAEYDELVFNADLIIGLTTLEGIQLSVAGEAIGAGRPLLLSDTAILRQMFGQGALFTGNDASSLADAVQEAFGNKAELARKSRTLGRARFAEWLEQAADVERRLG